MDKDYKKKYKNHPIYLFSSLTEDESLDSIKPKRIIIYESLVSDPIEISELAKSCCIFDDIDVISNKKNKGSRILHFKSGVGDRSPSFHNSRRDLSFAFKWA